ncbi:hypothetical protein F5X99DRAFT_356375 [Biscogniauxia marginata]|nr:hypothetical protein F5X99DRAFT_356375 [Biscogniauxia marginata]
MWLIHPTDLCILSLNLSSVLTDPTSVSSYCGLIDITAAVLPGDIPRLTTYPLYYPSSLASKESTLRERRTEYMVEGYLLIDTCIRNQSEE